MSHVAELPSANVRTWLIAIVVITVVVHAPASHSPYAALIDALTFFAPLLCGAAHSQRGLPCHALATRPMTTSMAGCPPVTYPRTASRFR